MKAIHDKSMANIMLNGGKANTISSKIKNEARVFILPTLIQHSTGIPKQSNKKEK
jgi:hypothetical protein